MAFEFAEYFGFNADPKHPLVPLTILSKEPGKETGDVGTFQQFVQEHTLAKEGTAALAKNDLATFNPDSLSISAYRGQYRGQAWHLGIQMPICQA